MPKTKFQDFIFTILMVLTMVYCMTLYNIALENRLSYSTFLIAFLGMRYEVFAAFFAQKFIAAPLVKKMVSGLLKPDIDRPIFMTATMAACTVALMAPMMTLFVTILHNGFNVNVPLLWLSRLVLNLPFAFFLQIFYVGPLVRLVFRTLFNFQWSFNKLLQNTSLGNY